MNPNMWSTRGEQGSASLEAVIGVPAFLLFVGLIIFAGRTAVAHQAVEAAAADAARAASIARTSGAAAEDAKQTARTSLSNQDLDCRDVDVTVDTHGFSAPLGQTGMVDVSVSCVLDLSDLTVPGVPGSRAVRVDMSSPVDTWTQR